MPNLADVTKAAHSADSAISHAERAKLCIQHGAREKAVLHLNAAHAATKVVLHVFDERDRSVLKLVDGSKLDIQHIDAFMARMVQMRLRCMSVNNFLNQYSAV